jgi:hypothetical protein
MSRIKQFLYDVFGVNNYSKEDTTISNKDYYTAKRLLLTRTNSSLAAMGPISYGKLSIGDSDDKAWIIDLKSNTIKLG